MVSASVNNAAGTTFLPPKVTQRPPMVAIWIALAAAVAVVIGSLGPWVKVNVFIASVSVGGMDADGEITIFLGLIASALLLFRILGGARLWTAIIAFLCLVLAGITGIADWNNVSSIIDESSEEEFSGLYQVAWGLQAVTIGGITGALALVVHWIRKEERLSSG
jgi:uncharacterized membrane protein (UPF0182 family)